MFDHETLQSILSEISEAMANQWQHKDGGWSDDPSESHVWTTAQVVLWLTQFDPTRYQKQIARGLRYLASTQHIEANSRSPGMAHDGGWGMHFDEASDPIATALALLAFIRHSQSTLSTRSSPPETDLSLDNVKENMKRGRNRLIAFAKPDGGYGLERRSSASATCMACTALKECCDLPFLSTPGWKATILPDALGFVEHKIGGGGWREDMRRISRSTPAEALGTAYCTYLLLGVLLQKQSASALQGLDWLREHQSKDGHWEPALGKSPVEATAWAIMALLAGGSRAKATPIETEATPIEKAVAYLLSKDLYEPGVGWREEPGGPHLLFITFYVCLALFAYLSAVQLEDETQGRGKVCIILGRDEVKRGEVKKLAQELGLGVVVLDERPDWGTTFIEKFEYYENQDSVNYALVLCTSEDMEPTSNGWVPGQNLLVMLGSLVTKLTPQSVCIGVPGATKLPTMLAEIPAIDLQSASWKEQMKQVLRKLKPSG